jgi:hypothetical protein
MYMDKGLKVMNLLYGYPAKLFLPPPCQRESCKSDLRLVVYPLGFRGISLSGPFGTNIKVEVGV